MTLRKLLKMSSTGTVKKRKKKSATKTYKKSSKISVVDLEKKVRAEGWKVPEKYPELFELVLVIDDNDIVQPTWWTGTSWDYGYKHIRGSVLCWTKRGVENYDRYADNSRGTA